MVVCGQDRRIEAGEAHGDHKRDDRPNRPPERRVHVIQPEREDGEREDENRPDQPVVPYQLTLRTFVERAFGAKGANTPDIPLEREDIDETEDQPLDPVSYGREGPASLVHILSSLSRFPFNVLCYPVDRAAFIVPLCNERCRTTQHNTKDLVCQGLFWAKI